MRKYLVTFTALCTLSFLIVLGIFQNYQVYSSLKKLDLDKAERYSKTAIFLPRFLNFLTAKKVDAIQIWQFVLEEVPTIKDLKKDGTEFISAAISENDSNQQLSENIYQNLEKINNDLNKIDSPSLNSLKLIAANTLTISQKLLNSDQKYIVILQNSDELRATGGFFGSFFILEINHGQLSPIQIQDVYVPDGQFNGYIEAPSGLGEYLSSGKGLRLPDANWWPNFPDSAKQIINFFNITEQQNYDGVIAVNLGVIEKILAITGDVYLPDYNTSVNQYNFAQIARADRNEFFPGSQEKANFLNHFFKMFKLQVSQEITKKPKDFALLIQELIKEKDLQFYSQDGDIAAILNKENLDGHMYDGGQSLYYFLVESNVGINKTNRLVDRQVSIDIQNEETITINFQNNNDSPYINYQRLYLRKDAQLLSVKLDQKPIEKIDQKIINDQWLEVGFLVPVLANNQTQLEIKVKNNLPIENKKQVFIQKQSGLQSTPYTINYQDQTRSFDLQQDQVIIFN